MRGSATRLRTDLTPCILHTDLFPGGGGLARAVPERASLYARHFARVLVLTTGFSPGAERVVAGLKERGALDERVVVKNFFADSPWAQALAGPPADLVTATAAGVETVVQTAGRAVRLGDRRPGEPFPFGYRYFDVAGRLLLTTAGGADNKYDRDLAAAPQAGQDTWTSVVARWVDDELAGLPKPVLFSLQRGLVDPVLLATTRASRKVVSLHNCHYRDPLDVTSGVRPTFRPVLRPGAVDEVVCLTQQQRRELAVDAPRVLVRAIPYPGRVPAEDAPPPTSA